MSKFLAILVAGPFFLGLFVLGMLGRHEVRLGSAWGGAIARRLAPLYGGHVVDAITMGYGTAFLMDDPPADLVTHEAFHRFQSLRESPRWIPGWPGQLVGALIYGVRYLVEYRRVGYNANRYEAEARQAAGQV